MKLKDVKIKTKLIVGFGIILMLTIVVYAIGWNSIAGIDDEVDKADDSNRLVKYILEVRIHEENFIIRKDKKDLLNFHKNINNIIQQAENNKDANKQNTGNDKMEQVVEKVKEYENSFDEYVKLETEKDNYSDKMRITGRKIQNDAGILKNGNILLSVLELRRYEKNYILYKDHVLEAGDKKHLQIFIDYYENILNALMEDRNNTKLNSNIELYNTVESGLKEYYSYFNEFVELTKKQVEIDSDMVSYAREIIGLCQDAREEQKEIMLDEILRNKILILGFLIVVLVLGVLIAIVIIRAIILPLAKSVDYANKLANGDMTAEIEVDNKDEIGVFVDALKSMAQQIREAVINILSGSDNIASASTQISASSQELSQSASEQASSLEDISSSIEQMNSNIDQNTKNAKQTEEIANIAAENIVKGSQKASETARSMYTIAEKISIIGDIAFQTNILALNAAVEAARAGEHGKGFGVIAAEIGKLAERSKIAAAEIDELSGTGVNNAEDSEKLLSELVHEIRKTASLVQEITAASQEQYSGSEQINTTILQLNEITQQNAAFSEEMATSAEELSSQADQLLESVSFFNVGSDSGTKQPYKALMFKKKKAMKENRQKQKSKGVEINLGEKGDTLDDEYERF